MTHYRITFVCGRCGKKFPVVYDAELNLRPEQIRTRQVPFEKASCPHCGHVADYWMAAAGEIGEDPLKP